MLNETQARELLHEAGEHITVRPGSTRDLIVRGRQAARTRQIGLVGAVAVVAALVVTGGLVLRPEGGRAEQPVDAPSVAEAPQAPPGKRLVGMGRIAVAVPEDWATDDVKCGTPMSDTVVFDSEDVPSCRAKPDRPVSSLHVVSASSRLADPFLAVAEPAGEINGVAIRRTHVIDTIPFTDAIVVDSEDVVMWVTSPDQGIVDEILDSVIVLPEGYVTVPHVSNGPASSTVTQMEDAGLQVRIVRERRPGYVEGSFLGSDPPRGSVVAVGSTVTVYVADAEREPPKEPDVDVTPCANVPPVPADTEIDTVLDKASGLLTYYYSNPKGPGQRNYTIDYENDEVCLQRPDIRRLVQHVLDTADWRDPDRASGAVLLTASNMPSAERFEWETTPDESIWPDAGEPNPCDSAESPLASAPSQLRTRMFQQVERSGAPASQTPVAVSTARNYGDSDTAQEVLDSLRSAYESCARTESSDGSVTWYRIRDTDRSSIVVDNGYVDPQGGEFVSSFTVAVVSGDHLALVEYSVGHDFTPDMSIPDQLLAAQEARLAG